MSKKGNKYRLQQPKPVQQASKTSKPKEAAFIAPELSKTDDPAMKWGLLLLVIIATFFTYKYTLKNTFTNWDDGLYVETNPYIKNLTWDNMKMILLHNITNNYYHPITMLTIAWNYYTSKMDPHAYYLTNVVIHIMGTCTVFFLMLALFDAMTEKGYGEIKGKLWLAAFGALFFGVHPMHVESVSWLAERKDVLYAFFYYLGIMAYLKYAKKETTIWMALVVVCYICSLFSKPLAVVFPFSLFMLDILLRRDEGNAEVIPVLKPFYFIAKSILNLFSKSEKVNVISKLLVEKAPYFLVSLAAGIWAWHAQKASGAVASFQTFTILQRLMFATYGFTAYVIKAFVPFHLCSYYPYPNQDMDWYFYVAPFSALAILLVPVLLAYRFAKQYVRVVIFGVGFFFFNVVFVLQFVSSGPAIMADRYSYVAYFGIFFLVVYGASVLIDKMPPLKIPVQLVLVGFAITLSVLCYSRTKIWHSTKTLWEDVIKKYPFRVQTAYKNLGNYYADLGPTNPAYYDSAYTNYVTLVKIHLADAGTYSNIANIYGLRKQFDSSLVSYDMALQMDPKNFDAHLDRAITYSMMKKYDKAIKDYDYAAQLQPLSEKLLENRASTYLYAGQFANAVADYTNLLKINPDRQITYLDRGAAEWDLADYKNALTDLLYYHKVDPTNGQCMFDLAVTYEKMKDYRSALEYAQMARNAKFAVQDQYLNYLKQQSEHPTGK